MRYIDTCLFPLRPLPKVRTKPLPMAQMRPSLMPISAFTMPINQGLGHLLLPYLQRQQRDCSGLDPCHHE